MCNGFPGNKKPFYFLCKQRFFSIITLRWEPGPSHLMQSTYPSKGQYGPAYGRCFEDSGNICPCADILIINLWNYSRERGKVIVRFVNTMILSHREFSDKIRFLKNMHIHWKEGLLKKHERHKFKGIASLNINVSGPEFPKKLRVSTKFTNLK